MSIHQTLLSPHRIRRKVFISYYHGDGVQADNFVRNYSHVFIPKALGVNDNDDFINSSDTDYVMRRIRERYLEDSTVTIVLLGHCTHSRRYVDWEIKSSLTQGTYTPNGLIGIILPHVGDTAYLPNRFFENWNQEHNSCYARLYNYPRTSQELHSWIEDAYSARTDRARASLISNSQSKMGYNSCCATCGVTH